MLPEEPEVCSLQLVDSQNQGKMAGIDQMSQDQMSSAAEAAQRRRELRRRKILMDPEERMRKLTGTNGTETDRFAQSQFQYQHDPMDPMRQRTGMNIVPEPQSVYNTQAPIHRNLSGTTVGQAGVMRRTSGMMGASGYMDSYMSPYSPPSMLGDPARGSFPQAQGLHDGSIMSRFMNSPLGVDPSVTTGIGSGFAGHQGSAFGQQRGALQGNMFSQMGAYQQPTMSIADEREMLRFFRLRIVICLLLGVLIRLSFMCSFGQQYVQSMLYPFMAFEISLLGYQYLVGMDYGIGQKGIWLLLLQLAGMNPQIIHQYKTLMGIITSAGDDFTAYFFAFVVIHLTVSS